VAGGKLAPEGKSKLHHKHTPTDLDMKMRIMHKYECGQSLSAVAHELGFAVLHVNTTMKDAAHIKEHVKATSMMKLTIIKKKA
jgi:hypothetical protein